MGSGSGSGSGSGFGDGGIGGGGGTTSGNSEGSMLADFVSGGGVSSTFSGVLRRRRSAATAALLARARVIPEIARNIGQKNPNGILNPLNPTISPAGTAAGDTTFPARLWRARLDHCSLREREDNLAHMYMYM